MGQKVVDLKVHEELNRPKKRKNIIPTIIFIFILISVGLVIALLIGM